eukprot:1161915-Pelagomonas_calceolata.AAC.1
MLGIIWWLRVAKVGMPQDGRHTCNIPWLAVIKDCLDPPVCWQAEAGAKGCWGSYGGCVWLRWECHRMGGTHATPRGLQSSRIALTLLSAGRLRQVQGVWSKLVRARQIRQLTRSVHWSFASVFVRLRLGQGLLCNTAVQSMYKACTRLYKNDQPYWGQGKERKGRSYIAVPAYEGSWAEARRQRQSND